MPRLWLATLLFGVELLLLLLAGAWLLRAVTPGVHAVNLSTIEPPGIETAALPLDPAIQLKASLQEALNNEGQLQAELAALQADLTGKTAACEMAVAPKPPSLPADRWKDKDLDLLKGCWLLGREVDAVLRSTDGSTGDKTGHENCKTRTGRICFDGKGGGQREQTIDCPSEGESPAPLELKRSSTPMERWEQPSRALNVTKPRWTGSLTRFAASASTTLRPPASRTGSPALRHVSMSFVGRPDVPTL